MSRERNVDSKCERRLAHNEEIRQRNKAKARENERKPRRFMTTVVMNPQSPEQRRMSDNCMDGLDGFNRHC
jgi:predicted TIM-barrel fold metal-dependent hydrolase